MSLASPAIIKNTLVLVSYIMSNSDLVVLNHRHTSITIAIEIPKTPTMTKVAIVMLSVDTKMNDNYQLHTVE